MAGRERGGTRALGEEHEDKALKEVKHRGSLKNKRQTKLVSMLKLYSHSKQENVLVVSQRGFFCTAGFKLELIQLWERGQ